MVPLAYLDFTQSKYKNLQFNQVLAFKGCFSTFVFDVFIKLCLIG